MRAALLRLICAVSFLIASPATAATITYGWTGQIDLVSPELAGLIDNGDPFVVTVEVDLDAVDNDPRPDIGIYGSSTITSFSFVIDGSFYVNAAAGEVTVVDELESFGGQFFSEWLQPFVSDPSYFTSWTNVPGYAPYYAQARLNNYGPANSGPLASDDLPTGPVDPADFNDAKVASVHFTSEAQETISAQGRITGFFVVPEPNTALLVITGLGLLSGWRRARV